MKRLIFVAEKDGKVEALGVKLDAKPDEVKVLVNGVDVSEFFVLEKIEVYVVKEEKSVAVG